MKAAATLAVVLGLFTFPSAAQAQQTGCTVQEFRPFSAAVWRLEAWDRGAPPKKVIRAQRRRLRCAESPSHRKAMVRTWRWDKKAFYAHRKAWLETLRWEPYVCGSRRYALPCAVTACESGYYFGHHSGAYGLLDSTWVAWGGGRYAPYPGAATPRQQAIIARKVWEDVGPSGWECKA